MSMSKLARRRGCGVKMMMLGVLLVLGGAVLLDAPHRGGRAAPDPARPGANGVPRPDHVVVVMEENHAYSEIIGAPAAPYINALAQEGALFTDSYGITHPSQPNYLDLFSGDNQGVIDSSCPLTLTAENCQGS